MALAGTDCGCILQKFQLAKIRVDNPLLCWIHLKFNWNNHADFAIFQIAYAYEQAMHRVRKQLLPLFEAKPQVDNRGLLPKLTNQT